MHHRCRFVKANSAQDLHLILRMTAVDQALPEAQPTWTAATRVKCRKASENSAQDLCLISTVTVSLAHRAAPLVCLVVRPAGRARIHLIKSTLKLTRKAFNKTFISSS